MDIMEIDKSIEDEFSKNKATSENQEIGVPPDMTVSSNPPIKPKKRISEFWNHYIAKNDPNDPDSYLCIYCAGQVHCTTKNGTTVLSFHIKKCKKFPANVDKRQILLSLAGESTMKADESIIRVGDLNNWVFYQEAARKALSRMLIIDELPFMFVQHLGFREFCRVVCPQFVIPSRSTIARDCIGIFIEERKRLKDYFARLTSRVCLTTDTWTSGQNLSYMCLTAHFIDDEWKLHKRIINFCSIAGHSGEFMGRDVERCLIEWGLKNILTMTVDNASSNDGVVRYLAKRINHWGGSIMDNKFLHMRCAAHILNLVVKDGLKEMNSSISKVHNFVKFVRSSLARLLSFKQCVEEEQIQCKGLVCLDVETRWNSTFLMLQSAVKFRKAFDSLYCKNSICNKEFRKSGGPPSKDDWEKASSVLPFLEIFYEATLNLFGSNYVTCNCYVDMIYGVGNLISEYCQDEDDAIKDMANKMKLKYDKYWGNVNNVNLLLFVALVLDPRYKLGIVERIVKDSYDKSSAQMLISKIQLTLKTLHDFYASTMPHVSGRQQQPTSSSSSCTTSTTSGSNTQDGLGMKHRLNLKYSRQKGSSETSARKSELDRYLAEDCEVNDDELENNDDPKDSFDILLWWKDQRKRFPTLAAMARDILVVPVSSVASESAFRTGGRVLDSFRTALTPRMVEALVCTQNWLRPSTSHITIDDILFELEDMEVEEGMKELTKEQPIIIIDESLDLIDEI